jgi:hypothetical protein
MCKLVSRKYFLRKLSQMRADSRRWTGVERNTRVCLGTSSTGVGAEIELRVERQAD